MSEPRQFPLMRMGRFLIGAVALPVFSMLPVARAEAQDSTHWHDLFVPSQYSGGIGYGLSRRPLFGQESVYRESYHFTASIFWNCHLIEECSFLLRSKFLDFLDTPRFNTAVDLKQSDSRLSFGAGLESTGLIPLGFIVESVQVRRNYSYLLGPQSGQLLTTNQWSSNRWRSGFEFWFGVPLHPEHLSLLFSSSSLWGAESPEDHPVYSAEIRIHH